MVELNLENAIKLIEAKERNMRLLMKFSENNGEDHSFYASKWIEIWAIVDMLKDQDRFNAVWNIYVGGEENA